MKVEEFKTKDGSSSLFVPELNETYHSTHGAVTESNYVFIQEGLDHFVQRHLGSSVNILEVGFGTGLNALLTAVYAESNKKHILYHTLETAPLDQTALQKLNYQDMVKSDGVSALFDSIHHAPWDSEFQVSDTFTLFKREQAIQQFHSETVQFDVIFFDAFAPSKQPDIWSKNIFSAIYDMMSGNGILVTYCAQGQFKRDLKSCGFSVESIPGPPGKKEMTRGIK